MCLPEKRIEDPGEGAGQGGFCRVLQGERLPVLTEVPLYGDWPGALYKEEKTGAMSERARLEQHNPNVSGDAQADGKKSPLGISIGKDGQNRWEKTLHLYPAQLTAGVGCRRGTSKEAILEALQQATAQVGGSLMDIRLVTSIDLKAKEAGLLEVCRELEVPFRCFSAEALLQAKGNSPRRLCTGDHRVTSERAGGSDRQ